MTAGFVIAMAVILLVGIGGIIGIVLFARHARRNPDPLHDFEDPDTGNSEAEWMRSIR